MFGIFTSTAPSPLCFCLLQILQWRNLYSPDLPAGSCLLFWCLWENQCQCPMMAPWTDRIAAAVSTVQMSGRLPSSLLLRSEGPARGGRANTDEHPRVSKCACYDQVVASANSRNRKKPPFYFIFSNYSSVHFTHLFFLLWPHHSLWKFSGQGLNPSRSFWPITGSLNPLDQARDHSSTVTRATAVRFLTYCHSRNSSKQPFRAVFPGSEVGEG